MHIWCVANLKGGVGKTTTAVSLGGLAADHGLRVLLVDLDPQGSLSSYFRLNPDTLRASSYNLFSERDHLDADFIGQLLHATDYPRLTVLPASTSLATLERVAIGREAMGLVLSKALAQIWDDFDVCILDCPPQLGVLVINALAACEHLIVPVQTEFLAMKGLERMVHTLRMLSRSRKKELPFTILPTMFDRRTQASVKSLRKLRREYEALIWRRVIPIDTKFRDASEAGRPPSFHSADSHGIQAYHSLFKELAPWAFERKAKLVGS